ncbi:hypothetical protein M3Y96_01155800 [Aphelenchoides besseyi]|nr:hypothetical protein M3Y96_01155800 [Aphelenchoides besseyi]
MTPNPRTRNTVIDSPFDAKKKCSGGSNSDNPNGKSKRRKLRTKPVYVAETQQATKRAIERERRLSREPLLIDGPPAESFDEEPLPAAAQPSNGPPGWPKSTEPLKTAELLPSQQEKPAIKEDKTQSSRTAQSVIVELRPMKNSVHLPIS